jgi:hypothetical protein
LGDTPHFQSAGHVIKLGGAMKSAKTNLAIKDAVRVKSAEMWLKMGEPFQALLELQRLTKGAWKHPWTENVFWRAAHELS